MLGRLFAWRYTSRLNLPISAHLPAGVPGQGRGVAARRLYPSLRASGI